MYICSVKQLIFEPNTRRNMNEDLTLFSDDELLEEIDYKIAMLEQIEIQPYNRDAKTRLIDDYLNELKKLYDEKRKRGIADDDSATNEAN